MISTIAVSQEGEKAKKMLRGIKLTISIAFLVLHPLLSTYWLQVTLNLPFCHQDNKKVKRQLQKNLLLLEDKKLTKIKTTICVLGRWGYIISSTML
jgi:hypothetical protein